MDSEDDDDYLDSGSNMQEDEAEYDEPESSQKQYKILKEEDVKLALEHRISQVCDFLSVSRGVACALLCRNNWIPNSACESWDGADDDGERNPDPEISAMEPVRKKGKPEPVCQICLEESRPEKMASAGCGHLFCAECWKTYIATAVSDGAACLMLCCPDPDCKVAITLDMVERFSSEAEMKEYDRYLLRSYVESYGKRKWCPAGGCNRAVELDEEFEGEMYEVVCDCTHKFCWNCLEENHRPLGCKGVAEWMEKNRSEAENTHWILAYTKPCPKCKRPIEKNQGCNHMTCKAPCGHQFCWLCGQSWIGHDRCNKFDSTRERAKKTLERYVYFYERWHSSDRSIKIATGNLDRARAKLEGDYWQMAFVVQAWELVVESLRVLKWGYPYVYYFPKDHGKCLVESMLDAAEAALERLHAVVEKEMIDDECFLLDDSRVLHHFRLKLVNHTSVARDYFKGLVLSFENDFASWSCESQA